MSDLALQCVQKKEVEIIHRKDFRKEMTELISREGHFYNPPIEFATNRSPRQFGIYGVHLLVMCSVLNSYMATSYSNYEKWVAATDRANVQISTRVNLNQVDLMAIKTIKEARPKIDKNAEWETVFNRLAKKWKDETSGLSSVGSMVLHPSYLEIISYGDIMIPFILKDLQSKPSHWFIALKTLAKTSPVRPEDAGNIKKMTEAWLAWGEANGKLG